MVFEGLIKSYTDLIKSGDARSNELPFVRNPIYVVSAIVLYVAMVIVGPRIMEKREAFQIRRLLIVYNFLSTAFSLYMTWEFIRCSLLKEGFDLFTELIRDDDTTPLTMALINVHWLYFISKFIEFLDTFFFVIRKKNVQISFLHVYHHGSMLMLQWSMVKYVPGGGSYFGPMLNCFIHTLMYAYYMLSAFGPHMQKYLWWKRYLTRMQMLQFIMILSHSSCCLLMKKVELVYHAKTFHTIHLVYLTTLFWLFNHFYQKAYNEKKKI